MDKAVAEMAEMIARPLRRENLISRKKPRVRRGVDFPNRNFDFTPEEEFPIDRWGAGRREIAGLYEMAWRWSRRVYIFGDADESQGLRHRSLYGSIRHQGQWVGAVELNEYQCPWWFSRQDLFDVLDEYSLEVSELAGVIAGLFTPTEFDFLIEHGTILHWRSAWMHPQHARGAIWAHLTNRIIDRMRGWSILILKAFPLEYQDGGSAKGFEHRQRAMFRHYESLIGVEPIRRKRSRFGMPEHGWMLCWNPRLYDFIDGRLTFPIRYGMEKNERS